MVIEDWYQRLQDDGLMDALAPYSPVVVGSYPLAIAGPDDPVEIVCRAVDLPAFARTLERSHGDREGFVLHGGSLDYEDAVFAEFSLNGMAVEVAAQPEHVHQRLGRATLGIDHVLTESGELARNRLRGRVANGQDWLDAAMEQFDLTRAALESLSTANPSLVRQVMGIKGPRVPWAAYVLPITIGITADLLIVLAGAARGSQQYTGLMLLLQASPAGISVRRPPGIGGGADAAGGDRGVAAGADRAGKHRADAGLTAARRSPDTCSCWCWWRAPPAWSGALRDRYRPFDTPAGPAR